jgi:prephenate dehydratase
MNKVSFQGENGAYSESAAQIFFQEETTTVSCLTFKQVLNNTEAGITDYSILPVENSIEGNVGESYDVLYSSNLYVIGEIYHKIEHCLIGTGNLENITTIYSHPQALGQCRNFLQKNNYKTVPTYDTAGSVKIIKDLNNENLASIASENAAQIYNMPIIKENIENESNNYTRFLILSKERTDSTGNDKTSIIFSIKHEPGTLFKIIKKFSDYSINLTKIESRPKIGTTWEYNFYVDCIGHESNEDISKILLALKEDTLFLKVIGSYPIAELN